LRILVIILRGQAKVKKVDKLYSSVVMLAGKRTEEGKTGKRGNRSQGKDIVNK